MFSNVKAKLLLITLFLIVGFYAYGNYAAAQYPGFGDPGEGAGVATGAGLAPVEPAVDGGAVPTGSTAQVVVRFRNEGAQPVQTGLIRLYPSSNVSAQVSLNQCEEGPLPSGAECAIALSIKGLQTGSWRVEMLMSHSGRTRLVTATVSGSVDASSEGAKAISDIEAIPSELDFETLNTSQTLIEPITLRNITSNPIKLTDVYIDTSEQAGYSLKSECDTLGPGQACIAVVSWSPKLAGRSSGVIVVRHDGPTGLTSVPLKGEYTPDASAVAEVFPQAVPGKGLLVSSQTEIDFGSGVKTASTVTVSLVNAGDAKVVLDDIQISGSDNGLSFKPTGCAAGTVLEPIEACPLTISWSPTRVGAVYDDIQISHDGARGVLVLPIRGDAELAVSQDQKAILLSDGLAPTTVLDGNTGEVSSESPAPKTYSEALVNPASVLDGYKITSFANTRAIVNGPGGSRIVFDGEEVVLGGIPWFVTIQESGIEFSYNAQRVLLLFDRSLSSVNRSGSSSGGGASEGVSGDGG